MTLVIALGNQLFNPSRFKRDHLQGQASDAIFFMREDQELCTYFRFHKQKIIFFLSAMRAYRMELEAAGYRVHYEAMNPGDRRRYEESLTEFILSNKISRVAMFEIEDKFFETRLLTTLEKTGVDIEIWTSPMFLTSRRLFQDYLSRHRRPFMKTFYEEQRRRLNVLMDGERPIGGEWSFDKDNRYPLPRNLQPPSLPPVEPSPLVSEVTQLSQEMFASHPGDASGFWLPIDRSGAKEWLRIFLKERLSDFGPYEDALPARSDFVFHSVLTPYLNTGLLEPGEVVRECLSYARDNKIPLASLEGFIRQVIGWREFVRGIYREFSDTQDRTNHWGHHNRLSPVWYNGKTGVPPLDRAIKRVWKNGYLHHIERLMVIGSLMLLLEVDPHEAHRWFMEMFIDSSDWVMGPNVYGMALFSDGGIFATKPYICGSNYYRKMGGDPPGDWCDGVDGLYWTFIRKHKEKFSRNPRLSMMARSLEKIPAERFKRLEVAAEILRAKLVIR